MSDGMDQSFMETNKRVADFDNAKRSVRRNRGNGLVDRNQDHSLGGVSDPIYQDKGDYVDVVMDDPVEEEAEGQDQRKNLVGQYTVDSRFVEEAIAANAHEADPIVDKQKKRTIYEREDEYKRRRFALMRHDDETEEQRMERNELEREERRIHQLVEQKKRAESQRQAVAAKDDGDKTPPPPSGDKTPPPGGDRTPPPPGDKTPPPQIEEAQPVAVPGRKRKRRWDVAPEDKAGPKEEPKTDIRLQDEPPQRPASWGQVAGDNEKQIAEQQKELTPAPKRLSNEVLDQLLPRAGYEILDPPDWYIPVRNQNRQKQETDGYAIPEDNSKLGISLSKQLPRDIPGVGELQYYKESDEKYFHPLREVKNEDSMTMEEAKEIKVLRLILKIKNGFPQTRKAAFRSITDNARLFGPKLLFSKILVLFWEPSLEDQERHLLVKILDRVLYKLGDTVRPYTSKILDVTLPLLIDEDYFARVEGRELISNLSKAVGLSQMIKTMRPNVDDADDYVRNTTSRAFAMVASALGIQNLLPFVTAVCKAKTNGLARHTGARIVQQIAHVSGSGVLPHLNGLVYAVGKMLADEENRNKVAAANALAALAEASAPYGIESFAGITDKLWRDLRKQRGRNLAPFLKCAGFIIPLMPEEDANRRTTDILPILTRNFETQDEDLKRVVLRVVQQCCEREIVSPKRVQRDILPEFFYNFWTVRVARDHRISKLVTETTVVLAKKVGGAEILERLVPALTHENAVFRRMAIDSVDKVVGALGVADVSERLEERLIDGLLRALQNQKGGVDNTILNAFGTVVDKFGIRTKQWIPPIVSTILVLLGNSDDTVREQAADLVQRIAPIMKLCGEDLLMGKLGSVLYEQLGEEYPGALGSILGALKAIVNVVGLSSMQPPIRDLLPKLTPILKNRHEKVQENAIDLVGRIADRGADMISPKEWMRICHELLEMLRAHKKGIRRAANNTFGYIANAIGPQDVLAALLTGLKVQERQLRVCIAVAIGIVAETCLPFTVLPAVMNEYRVPEKNVQNGVLKSMTFMFEYIGAMAKDYVYAIAPLLEDALMERDQVHRQTAATVVRHISLNVVGLGLEDVMIHFLNMLLPNIFETSPHVIDRIMDGIDGVRNAVGPGVVLSYTWSGLFQAARKVRNPYWKIYNHAYIQQADAMVPYYPDLKEDEYKRHELDVWI